MWWRMFDRHEMTVEELLRRPRLPRAAWSGPERLPGRSSAPRASSTGYDPDQDTKLHAGVEVLRGRNQDLKCEIAAMDEDAGLVELKVGPKKSLPDRICLIPNEFVGAEKIKEAVARYAEAWERGEVASQAVDDLLRRRPPRIAGHTGGPLIRERRRSRDAHVRDLVGRLDGSTLCIQGPPGTGKTYTAAAIIVELLRRGKRVGVTANSHKVILNLMRAVVTSAPAPRASPGGSTRWATRTTTRW